MKEPGINPLNWTQFHNCPKREFRQVYHLPVLPLSGDLGTEKNPGEPVPHDMTAVIPKNGRKDL